MSWHRQWHNPELRPEGPGSKLRHAMRQQMRDNDRCMMITPKVVEEKEFREPTTRPPSPMLEKHRIKHPPRIFRPKGWYLA